MENVCLGLGYFNFLVGIDIVGLKSGNGIGIQEFSSSEFISEVRLWAIFQAVLPKPLNTCSSVKLFNISLYIVWC